MFFRSLVWFRCCPLCAYSLLCSLCRVSVVTSGVCFSLSGSVLRDHDRGETSSLSEVKRFPRTVHSEGPVPELWRDRAALRKTISVDDCLLQQTPREHHRLLSRLERGKKKLRNIHVSYSVCRIALVMRYEERT